jgi:hypothetical protein
LSCCKCSGASAILASAADPRIKVLDAVNPWGDWPTWMSTSPFAPEDERTNYVKPEYLKKIALLEPIDWLPKMQAKQFRLQDTLFETNTPKTAKEKLRAAVPARARVVIYKTPQDFNAAINHDQEMDWIHAEFRALPDPPAPSNAALRKP